MNTIGIDHNLDRPRIKKLLTIGLFAAILTGIGDFLLGYADNTSGNSLATSVMASALNLADWQMIAGSLLGFFGIFLEGLSCFAVYRLMADASPKFAHLYRAGIFGYIWLAPVGCHLNMGILNLAYKYLLQADAALAEKAAGLLFYGFSQPVYLLLVIFWLPMMIVQFLSFSRGMTPYPKKAKWFCVLIGAIPALVLSVILGPDTALGAGIGTMFLSFGNAWMFGGLLATLPEQERFDEFEREYFKTTEG
ncbi:MAG: hypothetical protein IJ206_06205 [Oscillospiraceae bacterium]|nr:hypothetical protein [Oscillospiraceae bacterium]